MTILTRAQVRCWCAVLRRVGLSRTSGNSQSGTLALGGPTGVRMQSWSDHFAVEYRVDIAQGDGELLIPHELLDACRGPSHDRVTFTGDDRGQVSAEWTDQGIPQLAAQPEWRAPARPAALGRPANFIPNSPVLWEALADASRTAADQSTRFALDAIQLRGRAGEIVATDGRQMLSRSGFCFPWTDDRLIPALGLFRGREVMPDGNIGVTLVDDWIGLRAAEWTLWLKQVEGRFPNTHGLVPSAKACPTSVLFDDGDAQFLLAALPRLPGGDLPDQPVTLDLHDQAFVRAKATDTGQVMELALPRSCAHGKPIAISTNRQLLTRALELGFRELFVQSLDKPVLCESPGRQFVWAILAPASVIQPTTDMVRIAPPVTAPVVAVKIAATGVRKNKPRLKAAV